MAESPRRVFLLGSSSKWRQAIFRNAFAADDTPAHLHFHQQVCYSPDIDEKAIRTRYPEDLCSAIVEAKMERVLAVLRGEFGDVDEVRELYRAAKSGSVDLWIYTSDQVAVKDGAIREKPADEAEHVEFLRSYRNSSVETVNGNVLVRAFGNRMWRESCNHCTRTTFSEQLTEDVIASVVRNGIAGTCCGGFAVEDEALAPTIVSCVPSVEAVQGVDMVAVGEMIRDLWRRSCSQD